MHKERESILPWISVAVLSILALIPSILWATYKPLEERFVGTSAITTSIGQLSGLVGMALFALVLVLSTRAHWIEKAFGNLGTLYTVHHWAAGISFLLLMAHPLMLAARFIPSSVIIAAQTLLPSENIPVNFGIASLALMMLLLVLTFFRTLPYHIWKLTHQFLGGAFFLGGIHALFIHSDISQNTILRIYMIALITVGLGAFVYRVFLPYKKKVSYIVSAVNKLPSETIEVVMKAVEQPLTFAPGQFAFLSFESNAVSKESHPYSLIPTQDKKELIIASKALGDYTNTLHTLQPGEKVTIEGPFGSFTPKKKDRQSIWIAGGIGITPFLSMARAFNDTYPKTHLIYSAQEENPPYKEELELIAQKHEKFHFIFWNSQQKGHIKTEDIIKYYTSPDTHIMMCGPENMLTSLEKEFRKNGIKQSSIITEAFFL